MVTRANSEGPTTRRYDSVVLAAITKAEYFGWLDRGFGNEEVTFRLKDAQDAWINSIGANYSRARVLEIGGGTSRVLPRFLQLGHSCVNMDPFRGEAGGPPMLSVQEGVEVILAYIGDFEPSARDASFDLVFSVSVLEHIPDDRLRPAFADIHRLLKPGGRSFHATAVMVGDKPSTRVAGEVQRLLEAVEEAGLELLDQPRVTPELTFRTEFATESDFNLWQGWRASPTLEQHVLEYQIVSLKLGCFRSEAPTEPSR